MPKTSIAAETALVKKEDDKLKLNELSKDDSREPTERINQ